MRRRWLGCGVLIFGACSSVLGAEASNVAAKLLEVATVHSNCLQVRAAAIDDLGQLGANGQLDGKTAQAVVNGLDDLLNSSGAEYERNYIRYHAVRALSQIGTPARSALPRLAEIVGQDRTLNAAIGDAVAALTSKGKETVPTPSPASPAAPSPPTIEGLAEDLTSKDPVREMQALMEIQREKAPLFLKGVSDLMNASKDASVRRVAAQVTEELIGLLPNDDPKTGTYKNQEWMRIYVDNLVTMLQASDGEITHKDDERLYAVVKLRDVVLQKDKKSEKYWGCAVGGLFAASRDNKNKLVQVAAQDALDEAYPKEDAKPTKPGGGNAAQATE